LEVGRKRRLLFRVEEWPDREASKGTDRSSGPSGENCSSGDKDVTGEWRELHNSELHNLCYSPLRARISKNLRRHRSTHGVTSSEHAIWLKSEETFGRWEGEDNINIEFFRSMLGVVNWIKLAQDISQGRILVVP
jgi:hypothetical protein